LESGLKAAYQVYARYKKRAPQTDKYNWHYFIFIL
jgi:hypothetical protein